MLQATNGFIWKQHFTVIQVKHY